MISLLLHSSGFKYRCIHSLGSCIFARIGNCWKFCLSNLEVYFGGYLRLVILSIVFVDMQIPYMFIFKLIANN